MKKSTYLKVCLGIASFAFLSAFTAKAQITITENDVFHAGDIYINANDTIPSVSAGSAGANQTWNLSGLHNDYLDSDYIVLPSATPYGSSFPASNLVERSYVKGLGESYAYFNLGSDSLTVQGTVVPFGSYTAYGYRIPALKQIAFPATYNTQWSGSYNEIEKYGIGAGDSEKGVTLTAYTTKVDGWGSVTTPAGTYSALRLNVAYTPIYDSEYFYTGGTWSFIGVLVPAKSGSYIWLASGKGLPVATLITDSANNIISGYYLFNTILGVDNIQQDNAGVSVYPNPANTLVNIATKATSQTGYINVADITGREVETLPFNNGKAELNTSGYANGIYLYMITDMNGNLLDRGKFSVSH